MDAQGSLSSLTPVLALAPLIGLGACAAIGTPDLDAEAPRRAEEVERAPLEAGPEPPRPAPSGRLAIASVDEAAGHSTDRRSAPGADASPRSPKVRARAPGGRPPKSTRAPSAGARRSPPRSPGVQAGSADDNLQFNAFLRFMADNRDLGLPLTLEDRVVLEVKDAAGRPVANAEVRVDGILRRRTYADGRALLHPDRWRAGPNAEVQVRALGRSVRVPLAAARGRKLTVEVDRPREERDEVPLDLVFVLDTTGSMGDELDRLKSTLDAIVFSASRARPRPRLRLGMVLYRDRGDQYVTRTVPLTADLRRFERALASVAAGGGGDGPEDVQSGLRVAVEELDWRTDGIRLAFLVGDAPPHLDYGQTYTYVDALESAGRAGTKIAAVGASGLDRRGEVVWRQIAQGTMAPFVFLTYGETGDSEGSASSVSHHVGSNWSAGSLDALIVKMVKSELAHWRPEAVERPRDWFSADHRDGRSADHVLEELFERSVKQLVDYAVEPIGPAAPTLIIPWSERQAEMDPRIERRIALQLGRRPEFRLLETEARAELRRAVAEQLRLGFDASKATEPGQLLPAELAVVGKWDRSSGERSELLLELVRLRTGEVVSLSLMKIDRRLLP